LVDVVLIISVCDVREEDKWKFDNGEGEKQKRGGEW